MLIRTIGWECFKIIMCNWTFEFTYEVYIKKNNIEYDANESSESDLEGKSNSNAYDSGHWYVTGICIIDRPNNIEL